MYALVGCGECSSLWIVEGRPETSQCPRCGTTRAYEKRRQFVTTEEKDHAREVRASMLAARQDMSEEFADLDSVAEMEEYLEAAGVDDETYLSESGVDPEEVAAAGKQREQGVASASKSRQETVREALSVLDEPAQEDVVEYASERGVPPEYTREALEKLVRAGEVSEHRGRYRQI